MTITMLATMNKKAMATRGPKQIGSSRGNLVGGPIVGLGSSQLSGGSLIPRTGNSKFNMNSVIVIKQCTIGI